MFTILENILCFSEINQGLTTKNRPKVRKYAKKVQKVLFSISPKFYTVYIITIL